MSLCVLMCSQRLWVLDQPDWIIDSCPLQESFWLIPVEVIRLLIHINSKQRHLSTDNEKSQCFIKSLIKMLISKKVLCHYLTSEFSTTLHQAVKPNGNKVGLFFNNLLSKDIVWEQPHC